MDVKLDADATVRFATATAEAASAPPPGNQIAVIVDGEVASAPTVVERVSDGQVQIMGGFTADRAHRLAAILGGS